MTGGRDRFEILQAHQTCHTLLGTDQPQGFEIFMDARTAIGLVTLLVYFRSVTRTRPTGTRSSGAKRFFYLWVLFVGADGRKSGARCGRIPALRAACSSGGEVGTILSH